MLQYKGKPYHDLQQKGAFPVCRVVHRFFQIRLKKNDPFCCKLWWDFPLYCYIVSLNSDFFEKFSSEFVS